MRNNRFLWLAAATSVLVVLVFLYSTANAEEQLSATADTSPAIELKRKPQNEQPIVASHREQAL